MADGEKEGLQTDTGNTGDEGGTAAADSQADGTPSETKDETNWEQRHKDLQAEYTRTSQEAADLRTRVEQLEQPLEEPEEDLDLEGDETGFVDRKTIGKIVDTAVQKAVGQVRTQSANAYFRRTYSDLVKYESAIAGLMRSPKNPERLKGASPEERIDAAVKEFKDLTEEAKATATSEAEAAARAKEEAKRKASGLGSTATSTSASDEGEKSDEQELADRKARSAKRRGLA